MHYQAWINDILDFSKIESGTLLISPHSASIRESIYDIASIVAPKAKEQKISVNVDISPDTSAMRDDRWPPTKTDFDELYVERSSSSQPKVV